MCPSTRAFSYPKTALTFSFIAWKLTLLFVALAAPGPGYDSSTNLLFSQSGGGEYFTSRILHFYPITKLVRWDAIYFTQIAYRNYVFEQEWAFGWGFTKLLSFFAKGMHFPVQCSELALMNQVSQVQLI